jgi:hypothetical protein
LTDETANVPAYIEQLRRVAEHTHLRKHLNALLAACGQPPLAPAARPRRLGAGAWHDAFLLMISGQRMVARLRKRVIYGREEGFDEGVIRSDYAGVGEYYRVANERLPGICPETYAFAVKPSASGTVESYLGPTLRLGSLSDGSAYTLGQAIGRAFRKLHAGDAPYPGSGELIWTSEGGRGEDPRPLAMLVAEETVRWREGLLQLQAAGYGVDAMATVRRLEEALVRRARYASEPALVNSDITPENLIVRRGRFVGLIDPVPRIGNATRHAALFLCSYRLLLPSLHDAPRYVGREFARHTGTMARIADGYEAGYLEGGPPSLAQDLADEYWLWVLDLAIGGHARLATPLSEEHHLRTGGHAAIERRVREYLRVLNAA